ncbi:iron-sulfur cluster assembly protein [Acidiphilium sp. AL]|uniref:Iron-sulfur cluster assembly protein n=1 Tax=Acidiphilium iwatense TaxID=768198 RepID=A0ABS9E384_9PROT|nr:MULTISPECIES: iron-sulfur cluster assembly protein [Acidiphilium]MCF3948044.1 iron-sulfur cluster assembly protein [Acidiphilium iwatense]MCU4161192.1 iron-sulfur cluster assembly protein [Acidiphilium sp. AL]
MTDRGQVRIDAVRAALDQVTDPELDESVVELGFVIAIDITDDDGVNVDFRLPTYWCAANFSYLMAADMRDAVLSLPWVTRASIRLDEHMFIAEINDGIAQGKDFAEAFPTEASDDLASIRLHFGLKSFERRQEALLRHMLSLGHDPVAILDLDVSGLERLAFDDEGIVLRMRYLVRRPLTHGLPSAFVTRAGEPIMPETLHVYLRHIRRVGLNAEFNGALCRGLLAARYGTTSAALPPEPGLADFMRQGQAPRPHGTDIRRR